MILNALNAIRFVIDYNVPYLYIYTICRTIRKFKDKSCFDGFVLENVCKFIFFFQMETLFFPIFLFRMNLCVCVVYAALYCLRLTLRLNAITFEDSEDLWQFFSEIALCVNWQWIFSFQMLMHLIKIVNIKSILFILMSIWIISKYRIF